MEEKYFKLRKKWRPLINKFELGGFFHTNPIHVSGFFVMRIFSLKEKEYLPFYNYHLNYYLENNPKGDEQSFLYKVLEFIDKDINSRETLYYYNSISKKRTFKLSRFREVLKKVDKWELTLTNEDQIRQSLSYVQEIMNWQNFNDTKTVLSKLLFDEVGSDKFFIEYKKIIDERDTLKAELYNNNLELKEYKKKHKAIAPTTKIQIVNGDHKPLLDLLLQLRELENPITKRTYLSASPDTWASLISNYFEYSENNISNNKKDCSINWNTIRDYFLDKSGTELMKSQNREKYFHIKESNRLYK